MSEKINEKALLVRLNIGQWTARKQDKRVEKEVEEKYGAHDAGSYHKALVAREAINLIAVIVNEVRDYHYTNSLPWSDEGVRLLPTENYLPYTSKMSAFKSKFQAAVEEFISNYPALIEDAKGRLNGLFDPKDYPDVQKIERKFYFETSFDAIPESADIRVNIQADEIAKIRAGIEARVQTATGDAMKDLYLRLNDVVSRAFERLSGSSNIFRDTLISNIVELVGLLPRLNLTGDETLEALRVEAEAKLTKYDPQTLREYPSARAEVARNAGELLKKMQGYV